MFSDAIVVDAAEGFRQWVERTSSDGPMCSAFVRWLEAEGCNAISEDYGTAVQVLLCVMSRFSSRFWSWSFGEEWSFMTELEFNRLAFEVRTANRDTADV